MKVDLLLGPSPTCGKRSFSSEHLRVASQHGWVAGEGGEGEKE